jgi:predicted ATP-dependent endonuclease of OLD family
VKIISINIQNFRKLHRCRIDFSKETTLFVGANNSGKTSAMDALAKFLSGRSFVFNDFTISNRTGINSIGDLWDDKECDKPNDLIKLEAFLPTLDVWLSVESNEIHYVANIIPTLKWRGGKLGVRLVFQPKDISNLFDDYRDAYFAARTTETSGGGEDGTNIKLFPKNLCDFLEKKLTTYFSIKSYVLNPEKSESEQLQPTPYEMECFTDNPLKGIIKIDMIDAQRGFTDPDAADVGARKQLSAQMRTYYDKHLDPEKSPTPKDLEILKVTEEARTVFDKNLADKFKPAIKELEDLGYPGVTDPRITIATKVSTSETMKHDSAVQYALSKNDDTLKLPEKYNGLGYQNLISMVFDLMSFRDGWMREGKAKKQEGILDDDVIEPLHLVLVEEPEAHLHVQVQQVFIRKAYSVLRKHDFLEENPGFSTQLIISTHSSHIAREADFSDLRYFKRLPECADCGVATAKVINLSDVFGKEDDTDKFVTRYLQTTHCDLFFADAAILVEGSAENMLMPHFIKNKYPELRQRYISVLSINGRHSHRLGPLIDRLCLPTLVISDLDSVEQSGHHKAVCPERNKKLISGNYAITGWLIKENDLDKLFDLPSEKKIINKDTPYEYSIRIAYQIPEKIMYEGAETEALSSTFEDCLVYANYELFKSLNFEEDDTGSLVKEVNTSMSESKTFDDLHQRIYSALRDGKSDQKAEFALDLIYSIDPADLTIPSYIKEGLDWLQELLCPED